METLFVGRNIIFLPEVDSTNSYAISLLKNVNVVEGTVVYTKHQTAGKGQRGNNWNAEPASNTTASVILKPSFLELKKHFILYQIAALACYDVMAELLNNSQIDIKIKWPNDILVNEKKIAGILIENVINHHQINFSVIGIGINVNQKTFEQAPNASSLSLMIGREFDTEIVLKNLCVHLEKYYLMIKNDKAERINELYHQRLFKRAEWQDFEINGAIQKLLVKGVGKTGLLLLEDKEGHQSEYDVKQVKWVI